MMKEIINIGQSINWYVTVPVLAVLAVLAYFKRDKKCWSNIWKFIVNWWILAIFVLIEICWYFYLTNEKNSDAIHLFMQITPAITMTLFVGLLSRKTAVDNRKLQQDIAENNQLTQKNIAVDNRKFQKSIADDNQTLQQMNNLETRKSAAILQLTSEKQQQINNGVIELTDVAIEWDAVYGRYGNKVGRLTVINKIQNIINVVYKARDTDFAIDEKSEGIYKLVTKLFNIRLNDETSDLELKAARLNRLKLSNLKLTNLNLDDANLNSANLIRVNLEGAHLYNSGLIETKLNSANLTKAVLINANLTRAVLTNANFTGAVLTNAKITDTSENRKLLTEEQQNDVIWVPST